MRVKLRDGDKVQVSEMFLRHRIEGWLMPDIEWHEASIVDGGASVRIVGRGVSFKTEDLGSGDVRQETANESLARLRAVLQDFVAAGLNDMLARNAVDLYASALLDVVHNPDDKNVGVLTMVTAKFVDAVRFPEYR